MSELPAKTLPMVDGVERHNRYPGSFMIPSDAEKSMISVGDHVKIGFLVDRNRGLPVETERMWVKVTKVGETFVGYIDNDPVFITAKYMDLVKFEQKNILGIIHAPQPSH